MKRLLLLTGLLAQTLAQAATLDGRFAIELYFDAEAFHDEMRLTTGADGVITGTMHVPNDFDAPLERFELRGRHFVFDYIVPANPSRPRDFRVTYEGDFFDDSLSRFIGFARITEDGSYMATFVGRRLP